MSNVMMTEGEFREKVQKVYDAVESALESVDPDLAEAEASYGALAITLRDKSKCILSAQPSVRQLWCALASKGIAHHFVFDPASRSWLDDKGQGIEVCSFLSQVLSEVIRSPLTIKRPA